MDKTIGKRKRGGRGWPADLALRVLGLGMIAGCAALARAVMAIAHEPPPGPGGPFEFIVAVTAWSALSIGLALLIEGARLLRPAPRPPRAWLG